MFQGQRTDQLTIWELEITQLTQKPCGAACIINPKAVRRQLTEAPGTCPEGVVS